MLTLQISDLNIQETNAHLIRKTDNAALYAALSGAAHVTDISAEVQCLMAPGYRLIQVNHRLHPNDDEFEIALINDLESSVAYYNKVLISTITDLSSRRAVQNLAWRSPSAQHAAVLRNVVQQVLFDYLLERYDVILSDNPKTGNGLFFWQRQISNAIAYGLRVYYLQGTSTQFQLIPTQKALNSLVDRLWSGAHTHQDHFTLISKAALPAEALGAFNLAATV
ncbi:hypothetical protein ASF84_17475 [Pseudomonas sp. Leaf127]|uniref:hypothetical protein n=1 Tax=Pseudomonas sp. Leaf127 TaxID=1736267 RepID=UPI0007034AC0|nr:hypothetical protein [Pseudomonas sp. Leaf127]KQQ53603.1 hypothetical protein ASF84_17475 [Pseudomonas sp. Leaf127]